MKPEAPRPLDPAAQALINGARMAARIGDPSRMWASIEQSVAREESQPATRPARQPPRGYFVAAAAVLVACVAVGVASLVPERALERGRGHGQTALDEANQNSAGGAARRRGGAGGSQDVEPPGPPPRPILTVEHRDRPQPRPKPEATPVAVPAPPSRPDTEVKADLTRREAAMLRVAKTAISRQNFTGALEVLEEYGQAFRSGVLVPEATALRVEALCGAGRTSEANAEAKVFAERWPQSPIVGRVRRTCLKEESSR